MYRDFILYYGITEIQSDMGLFYENIKTERYLQFRKEVQSFYFRNESEYYGGKAICSIDFRLDDLIHIQKRSYSKMHETFSIIGGYMQLASTIMTLISFIINKTIPELKILNSIFNFNLKDKKLSMKIQNLKELNYTNNIYYPFQNQNYDDIGKKKKNKFNHKNKDNNNNCVSKNSLMGFENKNDNISSVINSLNNKSKNLLVKIEKEKEKDNDKDNNNNNIQLNATNISLYIDKKEKQNNNMDFNKNYIYHVGGFYPKQLIVLNEKEKENNIIKQYVNKINFNLFDYYCFRKITRKKNDIELFNIGLTLYKKKIGYYKCLCISFTYRT